jgi:thiosulfate dehydrogenase [quinone] large subunit
LLRVTIGTNIFIHGLSRILAGPSHFADVLVPAFQHTPLPASFVRHFAWAESIVGLLVLVGIRTRLALVAGSLLILTLTFGATLNQDWKSAGLQLIYQRSMHRCSPSATTTRFRQMNYSREIHQGQYDSDNSSQFRQSKCYLCVGGRFTHRMLRNENT